MLPIFSVSVSAINNRMRKHTALFNDPFVKLLEPTNSSGLYQVDKGSIVVFELDTTQATNFLVTAAHTTMHNNQSGTIVAWASYEPAGMSIRTNRVHLTPSGYKWLLYTKDTELNNNQIAFTKTLISKDVPCYMCIQNLENKVNYFYLKINSST